MSSIEWIFDQESASVQRIGAPKRLGGGRYAVVVDLGAHLDHGDATIARLDGVLYEVAAVADAIASADKAAAVQSITMIAKPGDEVRVRLAEVDPVAEVVVEGGAELVASATVAEVRAVIDGSGVALAVRLRFGVRADQVAQLVALLGATRARARSEQLSLLGAHPDGARAVLSGAA